MKAKKARAKMSRKAERQQKADALNKVLQQQHQENELKDIFEHVQRENAGTKIQKVVRGHKIRKQLPEIIEEHDRQQIINKINEVEQRANKIGDAAITIQKRFRQNKRKTTPITISNEPQTSTIKPANLIADNVSRNVIKNSLDKIVRKQNAVTTLQNAIRNRTAKRDMMKQRQLVGEAELKQMEAAKDKAIKDDAAKKLQASIKQVKPQNNLNQIKQAKEKIGAVTKRLLTDKVNSIYIPKIKKTAILNKFAVGQRLVVNKRKQLVSKKKHDAGVFGYETRQDFLDLAQTYKPIMTKGQKK